MNKHKTSHRQDGFTFIEMIVAVALFGVIMLAAQRMLTDAAQRTAVERTVAGFSVISEGVYAHAALAATRTPPENWQPGSPEQLSTLLPRPLGRQGAPSRGGFLRNGQGGLFEVEESDPLPGVTRLTNSDRITGITREEEGRDVPLDCGVNFYCIRTWLTTEELAEAVVERIGAAATIPKINGNTVHPEHGVQVVVRVGRPGTDSAHSVLLRRNCEAGLDEPNCRATRIVFNPGGFLGLNGGTIDDVVDIRFGEGGTLSLNSGTLTGVGVADIEALTVTGELIINN